ncbi:MAG: PspC domain-containing protein [Bacteroidales bacterium]|nr:PspC domain-containing protein [Bacteroidales bacterium]
MKKNFSVNIGKRLFNIDEDAFECLNNYLGRLRNYFSTDVGHDEIVADIEMRIAELLQQKIETMGQGIVVLEYIQQVINEMGEPGQLSDAESDGARQAASARTTGKLFRDPVNRKVGGVAAGIAAFFGVDPVWVRLLFILFILLYASGLIIYLILWIILPEAQTTTEKLEMQRQTINIGTMRDELASAGTGIKRGSSSLFGAVGEFLRNAIEIVARLIGWFFQLFGRLTGLMLLLLVLSAFIGMIPAFLVREDMDFGGFNFNSVTLYQVFKWMVPGTSDQWLFYLSFLLVVTSLIGLMIYGGLRLLLKWPPLRWPVVLAFILIFFAGVLSTGAALFRYSRTTDFTSTVRSNSNYAMPGKRLHITSGPWDVQKFMNPLSDSNLGNFDSGVLGEINLSLRPAPGDSLIISLIRNAASTQNEKAMDFAQNIEYKYNIQDTLLTIEPYFIMPYNDGMRYQELNVVVGIPVNSEIFLNPEIAWKVRYSDFNNSDNDGGVYTMTSSGLFQEKPEVPVADSTAANQ